MLFNLCLNILIFAQDILILLPLKSGQELPLQTVHELLNKKLNIQDTANNHDRQNTSLNFYIIITWQLPCFWQSAKH